MSYRSARVPFLIYNTRKNALGRTRLVFRLAAATVGTVALVPDIFVTVTVQIQVRSEAENFYNRIVGLKNQAVSPASVVIQ